MPIYMQQGLLNPQIRTHQLPVEDEDEEEAEAPQETDYLEEKTNIRILGFVSTKIIFEAFENRTNLCSILYKCSH